MVQFARPASDISTGQWTVTPLWSKINDVVGSGDAIEIASDNDATDVFTVTLTAIDEPAAGSVVIRWRTRKGATGGMILSETVELLEGASTVRATYGPTAIPDSASFATRSYTLSTAERDAITDWGNLRIRFTRTHTSTSNRNMRLADIELEAPDAGGQAVTITPSPVQLHLAVPEGGQIQVGVVIRPAPVPLLLDLPDVALNVGDNHVIIRPEPVGLVLGLPDVVAYAAVQPEPWDPHVTFSAETKPDAQSLWTGLVRSLPVWSAADAKTSYANDGTPTAHSGGGVVQSWDTGSGSRQLHAIRLDPGLSALDLGSLDPADAGALFMRFRPETILAMGRLFGFADAFEGRLDIGGVVYNDAFKAGATVASSSDIATARWWSLLFEWDKVAGVNRLYIDGALVIDQTGATTDPGSGTLSIGNRTGEDDPVDGWLAAAHVWSRNLTAAERALISGDPWAHHRQYAVTIQPQPVPLTLVVRPVALPLPFLVPTLDIRVDWDADGVFEIGDDIVPYLERFEYDRGASFDGSAEAPGTWRAWLHNDDDRFSPDNAASPLAGQVKPGRAMWGKATHAGVEYALCFGFIRRVVPLPGQRLVQLLGQDPLYRFNRAELSLAAANDRSLRDFRDDILDEIGEPAARRDLAYGPETDIPITGADQVQAFGRLVELNHATGSLHFIQPSTDPAVLYRYITRHRVSLATGAPVESFVDSAVDGFAIEQYDLTDEGIINSQRATPTRREVGAQVTVWESPAAIELAAGETRVLWASFADPVFSQQLSYTVTAGSPTVTLVPFSRSAKITIAAGAGAVAIDGLKVLGQPAAAIAGESALATDAASITAHGERRGPPISSDYLPSIAAAQGLADWWVYRYADPKPRPVLVVEDRWPSQLQREVGDRIAVTFSLLSLTDREFLIRHLTTVITDKGRRWTTTYQLEEAPATDTWFTLGGTADEGIGGSGRLAY